MIDYNIVRKLAYKIAYKYKIPDNILDDIVGSAVLLVLKVKDKINLDKNFQAYIYSIIVNHVRLESKKLTNSIVPISLSYEIPYSSESQILNKLHLYFSIKSLELSKQDQLILDLFLKGYTSIEIAKVANLEINNVLQKIFRIKKRLRKTYNERE